MKKKAQISIFIFIGITLLITAVLGYYFLTSQEEKINLDPKISDNVESYVDSCIKNILEKETDNLLESGLVTNPENSRLYQGTNYAYRCLYEDKIGCVPLSINKLILEEELSKRVNNDFIECNFEPFIITGNEVKKEIKTIKATITETEIIVKVSGTISLTKGKDKKEYTEFSSRITTPLGALYLLSTKIIFDEIVLKGFDESKFMSEFEGILIEKHKPYPDIVYSLTTKENNKTLNFALQGTDKSLDPKKYLTIDSPVGICVLSSESSCLPNIGSAKCTNLDGVWTNSLETNQNCNSKEIFKKINQNTPNKECQGHKSGTSWCFYDGIAGKGFDLVGSRHFKQTCIDGKVFTTECADYREEMCTQVSDESAVCKVNRWQDCASQSSKADCENPEKRDCYWVNYLEKAEPYKTVSYDYTSRKCIPEVPPGLRFWEAKGKDICSLANEQRDFPDYHSPLNWVDSTGLYCYFMADCGDYINFVGAFSDGGFSNTDGISGNNARPYIYTIPLVRTVQDKYQIKLSANTAQELTGSEFDFPEGKRSYMSKKDDKYENRMKGFSPKISLMPPKVEFDIDSMNSAICTNWKAPIDKVDCSKCGDNLRHCSEYRCKSLGKQCNYDEINGFGKCSVGIIDTKLDVKAVRAYSLNSNIDPIINALSIPAIKSELPLEKDTFRSWQGYDLGEIDPYEKIVVIAESDKSMNCVAGELPNSDFDRKSSVLEEDSKSIPIIINAESIEQQDENNALSQLSDNPLDSLFVGENIEKIMSGLTNQINSIKSDPDQSGDFTKFLTDYGLSFGGSADPLVALADNKKTYDDNLKSFVDNEKNQNKDILIARSMGRAYHLVKCSDSTNTAEGVFFITYTLKTDTKKPELVYSTPKDGEKVSPPFVLSLKLNEPAECRYSDEEKEYNQMNNTFECERFAEEFLYSCVAPIESKIVYVVCKDKPLTEERYFLNLMQGSENMIVNGEGKVFKVNKTNYNKDDVPSEYKNDISDLENTVMDDAGIIINKTAISAQMPAAFNDPDKTIYIKSSLPLEIRFPKKKDCKLTRVGKSFEEATQSFTCDEKTKVCTITPQFGKLDIVCRNVLKGNRNEDKFAFAFE